MAFQIGFTADHSESKPDKATAVSPCSTAPKQSLVQVFFPSRNRKLAYYNDQFDLKPGDLVYVDGKLAGIQGYVVEVSYHFKIKLSEYKRVTAVVDTKVSGRFFVADSHFLTFDPAVLPFHKVLSWFHAPVLDEEEYVIGLDDDDAFPLDDLSHMHISDAIAERGHTYYLENRVEYLCLEDTHGHALVQGSEVYEVEFEYEKGAVRNLICTCPCGYTCKHEFAVMLQLRQTLEFIMTHYAAEYTGYFAAVSKSTLFSFAIDRRKTGSFILE